jgi:hypothetical protein
MTTFSVVGKNVAAAGGGQAPAQISVTFPESLKFEVPEIKNPDINFNPTFSPTFSPQFCPTNVLDPQIKVQVEPTPFINQVQIPPPGPIYLNATLRIKSWKLSAIMFANTLFFVILLKIIKDWEILNWQW